MTSSCPFTLCVLFISLISYPLSPPPPGDFYYYGQAGLPSSHLEAAIYYQRAADLKHTQAIFNLGGWVGLN